MAPASRLYSPSPSGGGGSNITIKDEGVVVQTNPTVIDFRGSGIQASLVGGEVKVDVPPPPPPAFGYFAGGNTGSTGTTPSSTTSRLAFDSDTSAMVSVGALNGSGPNTGFNSSTFGYFSRGGSTAIGRLDFASSGSAMTSAASSSANTRQAAANSATFGYIAGGQLAANIGVTDNDRLDFSSDTSALVSSGALTVGREWLSATNSSLAAYFSGGYSASLPGDYATTDKLLFASDSSAMTAVGSLIAARSGQGAANSTTVGYYAGGTLIGTGTFLSNTYGLLYSSDASLMTAKGSLSGRYFLSGVNSTTKGYFAGGFSSLVVPFITALCEALIFASDTSAMTSVASLTAVKSEIGGCQSGGIL